MQLRIPTPDSWIETRDAEGGVLTPSSAHSHTQGQEFIVGIKLGPMQLEPEDLPRWQEEVLRHNLPAGMQVGLLADVYTQTVDHWPVRLIYVRLTGNTPAPQLHVYAFFSFFEYVASAAAGISGSDTSGVLQSAVTAILKRGQPDFAGPEVVALAQLFERMP